MLLVRSVLMSKLKVHIRKQNRKTLSRRKNTIRLHAVHRPHSVAQSLILFPQMNHLEWYP